jgi:WD40 repeat protein
MLTCGDRETSLVVGTGNNMVLTVDRESMKRTNEVTVEGAVTALSVLEGSKTIVCGTEKGNIYNLQVGTGKTEAEAPEKKTTTIKASTKTGTLSKTGSSVPSGDVSTPQGLTATLKESAHVSKINTICFPKGFSEVFATCCNEQIKVWALKRRQELLRIIVPGVECNHVCFSDDGKMILSGWTDGKIRAFFPQSGKLMWTIEDAHANGVSALTITPDNEIVISGGQEGEIRIWKVSKDKRSLVESMKEHRGRVTAMHLNATGELVSCSADGSCIIWDIKNRVRILCIFEKTIFKRCCFCPDGSQLLTVGSDARIAYWSAFDGELIRHLMASDREGEVNALDISQKGNLIVTGGQDPLLRVWSYHEGRCVHKMEGHFGPITDAKISPDSNYVVSAGSEGELAIFRLNSELQSIK